MEMKNKLVMKTASWTLSLALIVMSPGVNCYAAMAEMSSHQIETVPLGIGNGMTALGADSADNFLNAESPEMPADDVSAKIKEPLLIYIRSEVSLPNPLESGRKPESRESMRLGSGFKAMLAKPAARVVKMTRNIRQAVLNHISNGNAIWSHLFDGGLQPAYGYANAPVQGRFSLSNRPAFQLNTFQETASGTGGVQAEPPAPVPDNNAVLKSQIAAEENRLKTISFIIKNMGVYKTAQDVIVDIKKDPASVDSEALVNLAMTAQSAVVDASLLPEMDKITSQDLSSAEVKASVTELFETGQTAVQDIQDMSNAAGEIAKALSENKASTQDAAQWKTLTSDLQNFASVLKEKIGKLNPPSQAAILAPKLMTTPSHSSNPQTNRIIFGVSWLILMIAASPISLLAVVGVIIGAGIGAAMTPKGQDASLNMIVGMLLGMGIGAIFSSAAAHAATVTAVHAVVAAGPVLSALGVFGGGVAGALIGGVIGGFIGARFDGPSGDYHFHFCAVLGAGIGAIAGGIIGATLASII